MERKIKYIVLHCTATVGTATVSGILNYWKKKLGWKNPGYHFIIGPSGDVSHLQPLEKPSNGVRGYNAHSINISYIGGVDDEGMAKDTRTPAQFTAMAGMVKALHGVYPDAEVLGHRDFKGVNKACPSFEVKEFVKNIKL